MYLVNYTQPSRAFFVNLLAIYSFTLTWRYWNRVKYVLWSLHKTTYMSFFYSLVLVSLLLKYADVGYLLDPYNVCFQAWYVFLCDSTIATWQSLQKIMINTISNHQR